MQFEFFKQFFTKKNNSGSNSLQMSLTLQRGGYKYDVNMVGIFIKIDITFPKQLVLFSHFILINFVLLTLSPPFSSIKDDENSLGL
jgi:hypothetical protein